MASLNFYKILLFHLLITVIGILAGNDCTGSPPYENDDSMYGNDTQPIVGNNKHIYGICKYNFRSTSDEFSSDYECKNGQFKIKHRCVPIKSKRIGETCQWNSECQLSEPDSVCHLSETDFDGCYCRDSLPDDVTCRTINRQNVCVIRTKAKLRFERSDGKICLCGKLKTKCYSVDDRTLCEGEPVFVNSVSLLDVPVSVDVNKNYYGLCKEGFGSNENGVFYSKAECQSESGSYSTSDCEDIQNKGAFETCLWSSECQKDGKERNCTISSNANWNECTCKNEGDQSVDCVKISVGDKNACLQNSSPKMIYENNNQICFCDRLLTTCEPARCIGLPAFGDNATTLNYEVTVFDHSSDVFGLCNEGFTTFAQFKCNDGLFEVINTCNATENRNTSQVCQWTSDCTSYSSSNQCIVPSGENFTDCDCRETFTKEINCIKIQNIEGCQTEDGFKMKYMTGGRKNLTCLCPSLKTRCIFVPNTDAATTTGASTVVLPTSSDIDYSYPFTTDYYWGTMKTELDCAEEEPCFKEVEGPFGFQSAIQLDGTNCMKQDAYQYAGENCTLDLSDCPDGLSFSLWVNKPFAGIEWYDVDIEELVANDSLNEYLFSTGGDKNGSPGVAVYMKGLIIGAVACNGNKLWKIDIINPMKNNITWFNVGVRWKEAIEEVDNVTIGGLELFLNAERIGQVLNPVTVTPLPPLDPPEVMIGCHKTQENQTYMGFSEGQFDECAMWTRQLEDPLFFLGGYSSEGAAMTPEKIKDLLNKVDTSKPDQLQTILSFLNGLEDEEDATSAPTTEAPQIGQEPASTVEPTDAVITTAAPDPAAYGDFLNLVDIVKSLTQAKNVAPRLAVDEFEITTGILTLANRILREKNTNKWDQIHRDSEDPGAAGIIDGLINYYSMSLYNTIFDNTTEDIYCTKVHPNIIYQCRKYTVETFQKKKSLIAPAVRSALEPELQDEDVLQSWDLPHDRVEFPTDIFRDKRCSERAISTTTFMFKSYGRYATTRVNPAATLRIPDDTHKAIDSKVVFLGVRVDPKYIGDAKDPFAPLCLPDPVYLDKNRITYRLTHRQKMPSVYQQKMQRRLLFHENEDYTEVTQRHCVRWNANLSDFGVWDTDGCKMVTSNQDYTVCKCDGFGLFAVLAEKTDPIVVPPEMEWEKIVKYVLYSISGILLLLYIIVIIASTDLKDQFHLMGMCLAVSVLIGSIAMCASDIHSIREDRHLNVTIGTLIHYFYTAEGIWLFLIAFASFKAITKGIVGGKFKYYAMIGWALPLILIGFPFAFFLHDLGRDPRCFISWEDEVKLVFFCPQFVLCGMAIFCALVVIFNMSTPALRKEHLVADYGTFCRGVCFMTIYVSVTWCFGFLSYMRFDKKTEIPNFYPVFQILNACTGILIFIFMGLASNRYRWVLMGKAKTRRENLFNSATKNIFARDRRILENESTDFDKTSPLTKSSNPDSKQNSARSRKSTAGSRTGSGQVSGRPTSRASSGRPQTVNIQPVENAA